MKRPREIEFQETVIQKLQEHDISPYSVIFTYSGDSGNGLLSITFYIPQELDELLELLEYRVQCDKSGYTILRNTNTLLISGIALIQLYTKI